MEWNTGRPRLETHFLSILQRPVLKWTDSLRRFSYSITIGEMVEFTVMLCSEFALK